jgi:hypothetical protein
MNQNSAAKTDGIVGLKIIISVFENLPGQIDPYMNSFVGTLLAELSVHLAKKKPDQTYLSMLLQALSVAFYNNALATFQICESNNMTITLF